MTLVTVPQTNRNTFGAESGGSVLAYLCQPRHEPAAHLPEPGRRVAYVQFDHQVASDDEGDWPSVVAKEGSD
jgi:hypothetical protein